LLPFAPPEALAAGLLAVPTCLPLCSTACNPCGRREVEDQTKQLYTLASTSM